MELGAHNSKHGGPGWELGRCLWSPARARNGSEKYRAMTLPLPGDFVWNTAKSTKDSCAYLVGHSKVKSKFVKVTEGPPDPEVWAGYGSYYRIDLTQYVEFDEKVDIRKFLIEYDEILRDEMSHKPKYFPFATHGRDPLRFVQGLYLAKVTEQLDELLRVYLSFDRFSSSSIELESANREFVEHRRLSREREFFARNPSLKRDAISRYGTRCMCCGFDFSVLYGKLGEGYIECHHNDPLSERPESLWTTELKTSVNGVALLCANCHRMVHRRKPALHVDDLRQEVLKHRLN